MGYSYTASGSLCCDLCPEAGARKYSCPFGYCPPIAACPTCRKEKAELFSRAFHRQHGCEEAHNKHVAQIAARSASITAGNFCLRAALGVWENGEDTGVVHVIFEGPNNRHAAKFMPKDVYQFQTGNETIEYFEARHGGLLPDAPLSFHTKEVSVSQFFLQRQR